MEEEGGSDQRQQASRRAQQQQVNRLKDALRTVEDSEQPPDSRQKSDTNAGVEERDLLPFSLEDYLAFDADSREEFDEKLRKQSEMNDRMKQLSLFSHPYVVRRGEEVLVKRAVTTRMTAHSKTSKVSKFHAPEPHQLPLTAPAAVISNPNRWIDRHWISSAQAALRISNPGPLPWKQSRGWTYDPIRSEWVASDNKPRKISPSMIDRSEYLSGRIWNKINTPRVPESERVQVKYPYNTILTRKQIINRISFPGVMSIQSYFSL